MQIAWAGYSPGENVCNAAATVCAKLFFTVTMPAYNILVADVFGIRIFH